MDLVILVAAILGGFLVGWATGLLAYFAKTGQVVLETRRASTAAAKLRKEKKGDLSSAEIKQKELKQEAAQQRGVTMRRLAIDYPHLTTPAREEIADRMESEWAKANVGSDT